MDKNFAHIVLKVWLVCVIVWWGVAIQKATAQKPPTGVLALRSGGYAEASHHDAFDTLEPDGITVEAWFYLTDLPEDEERWIVFAKPGSYEMFIRGREPHDYDIYPKGTVYVDYLIYRPARPNSIGRSGAAFGLFPGDFPLNRWVHIAIQIRRTGGGIEDFKFFDGHPLARGQKAEMGRSNTPFFIGGAKSVQITELFGWGWEYTSLKGWIDEVRISNTFRYPASSDSRKVIHPPRRFEVDAHTVALWHFDEGPGVLRYADVSGSGHTLLANGTLVAVDAQERLPTTWGTIKQR